MLDPRDDVATYNLAIALAETDRKKEAMSRYDETLRLVPDHALAQQNLTLHQSGARRTRHQSAGSQAGRLDDASTAGTERRWRWMPGGCMLARLAG